MRSIRTFALGTVVLCLAGCEQSFDPFVGEWVGRYDLEVSRDEFLSYDLEGTMTTASGAGDAQLRFVGSSIAGSAVEDLSCDAGAVGGQIGLVCTGGSTGLLFFMEPFGQVLDGYAADESATGEKPGEDLWTRAKAASGGPGPGYGNSVWRRPRDGDRRVSQADAELVSDVVVACDAPLTIQLMAEDDVQSIEADLVQDGAIVIAAALDPEGAGAWSGTVSESGCGDSEAQLVATAADGHTEWVTLDLD